MLTHRFIDTLVDLEKNQLFLGNRIIDKHLKVLVIGTFNPDFESYPDPSNNAAWFYGRTQKNKFWHYFPMALSRESLHPAYGWSGNTDSWKQYCNDNGVVIIDMLKAINNVENLTSQKDSELEYRIKPDLSNVEFFKVSDAFKSCTFEKVLYSLAWSDARNLPKLVKIRETINTQLLRQGTIKSLKQIRYCKAPWRNDSGSSWDDAINK
jgi:hypothetical protein